MQLGRIREIWRHPVKSMQGERIERTPLGERGVPGDRAWAVRDEVRGGIRGGKKIPGLMRLAARYLEDPKADAPAPAPEITLPDGTRLSADAPDAAARVSDAVGAKVTLWPLRPRSDLAHYRRGAPTHADVLTELRSIFGREEGEPLPDLASLPRELFEYESPPGTYFDAFPLLLVTDASLRRLAELAPASRIDVRRFRPNFVIEASDPAAGFVEAGWAGARLRLGDAVLEATIACPRCVMITHGFADLPRDPGLMRTVVREANQCVGIYAVVREPGEVRVGDAIERIG
jgi:uncharacterized protein YcbX